MLTLTPGFPCCGSQLGLSEFCTKKLKILRMQLPNSARPFREFCTLLQADCSCLQLKTDMSYMVFLDNTCDCSCRLIRRLSCMKQCIRLYMSADSNILKLQQRGLLQNVFPEAKLVISRLFCNIKTYATL